MVCCVLIAMVFALPVLLARMIVGAFGGAASCSMAWRPISQRDDVASQLALPIGPTSAVNEKFTDGRFSFRGRVKSFSHAGRGAFRLLRHEHSAWIQVMLAAVAVTAGLILDITIADWRWIVLAIGLVFTAEGLNTAIENACNRISLEYSEHIKNAKDVAAGAVLLSSITAAIVGVQTFMPYLSAQPVNLQPVLNCIKPPYESDRWHPG